MVFFFCSSVPENQLDNQEAQLLEKEMGDDSSDEEEGKMKKKQVRRRWVEEEVEELKKYFKEYLQTKTTPRNSDIEKKKKKIRTNGGILHLRANHLIVKKISNMNHAKQ